MKNSFVLHNDSLEILKELTNEEAGILFKAIASYNFGEELELEKELRMVFLPFKNQFIRDLKKYKSTSEINAINGSKGGLAKVANATKTKRTLKNVANVANLADSDSDSDSEKEKEKEYVYDIVEFLNNVCKTQYKAETKSTANHINARLNEGFSVEDLKLVISHQNALWSNNAEMSKYIRPQTLFNSEKFQGYLNDAKRKNLITAKPERDDNW